MNRRQFLFGLGALVGGVALEQAIPVGRVWSFPTEIVVARPLNPLIYDEISAKTMEYIVPLLADNFYKVSPVFYRLTRQGRLEHADC